jgi:hypothetical protein
MTGSRGQPAHWFSSKMIPDYFIYEISERSSAVKAKSFQVAWYFVRAISQLVPETDCQVF